MSCILCQALAISIESSEETERNCEDSRREGIASHNRRMETTRSKCLSNIFGTSDACEHYRVVYNLVCWCCYCICSCYYCRVAASWPLLFILFSWNTFWVIIHHLEWSKKGHAKVIYFLNFGVASGICICSGSSLIQTLVSILLLVIIYFLTNSFFFLTTFVLMISTKGIIFFFFQKRKAKTNLIFFTLFYFPSFFAQRVWTSWRKFRMRQQTKGKASSIIMMIITKQKDLAKMIIRIIGWAIIWFEMSKKEHKNV